MNNYPEWWNTTITIYNKFTDPATYVIRWYKTKVEGAFWKYAGNKVTIGQTVLETKDIICRIRKSDKYLDKALWINQPNDVMGEYFTLGRGDIIVKGDVPDMIDEYTSGRRSTDLLNKYKDLQGCMEIEQISNNTGVGLGQEHYLVRGV